jgi:hypothetical protein
VLICLYTELNLKAPSHVTILIWIKKIGLHQLHKTREKADDWIIILDESVEFGSEKLLVILGIREKDINFNRPLQYYDMECLVSKVSSSWKGEDIKKVLDELQCNIGRIKYAVADMGNAIKNALYLSEVRHVEDVTHKLSLIIKHLYEKDSQFIEYTKKLAYLRGSLCLSRLSYILPPAQRVHSRFMNLKPIVDWGLAVIKKIKENNGLENDLERLNSIIEYEGIVKELDKLVHYSISIQEELKNNGLSQESIKKCKSVFKDTQRNRRLRTFENQVMQYLEDTIKQAEGEEKILCASDILESSFGKYKNSISNNLSIGITDLSLSIAAYTVNFDNEKDVREALTSVKVTDIMQWKSANIGKTLTARRMEVLGHGGKRKKITT